VALGVPAVAGLNEERADDVELLAHRGAWNARDERNTPDAIGRAFAAGWGVETDVRDLGDRIAISHDAPMAGHRYFLDDLLRQWRAHGSAGRLALNVKADGLQSAVNDLLLPGEAERCFVFDASVPDERLWLRDGRIPTFVRHSELEPVPTASPHYQLASGVWLDAFDGQWWDAGVVRAHLSHGLQVAIVSPELHGRDHRPMWGELVRVGLWDEPGVMLCTDLPAAAMAVGCVARVS
jgi:hypothetical protein